VDDAIIHLFRFWSSSMGKCVAGREGLKLTLH
jgi:hypothetical protein